MNRRMRASLGLSVLLAVAGTSGVRADHQGGWIDPGQQSLATQLDVVARHLRVELRGYGRASVHAYDFALGQLEAALARFETTARMLKDSLSYASTSPWQIRNEVEVLATLASEVDQYVFTGSPYRNLVPSWTRATGLLSQLNARIYAVAAYGPYGRGPGIQPGTGYGAYPGSGYGAYPGAGSGAYPGRNGAYPGGQGCPHDPRGGGRCAHCLTQGSAGSGVRIRPYHAPGTGAPCSHGLRPGSCGQCRLPPPMRYPANQYLQDHEQPYLVEQPYQDPTQQRLDRRSQNFDKLFGR